MRALWLLVGLLFAGALPAVAQDAAGALAGLLPARTSLAHRLARSRAAPVC